MQSSEDAPIASAMEYHSKCYFVSKAGTFAGARKE